MTRRPYSIKTRIKTTIRDDRSTRKNTTRRPYSIKTRIKTFYSLMFLRLNSLKLADHIPLKQGLRRTKWFCWGDFPNLLADHIPLKQGLRLLYRETASLPSSNGLADHIPLKQGLRRFRAKSMNADSQARRPYSIKTRIKTGVRFQVSQTPCHTRRPYSIKTRIKTSKAVPFLAVSIVLADHTPLKQGFGNGGRSSDLSDPSDLSDLSPQSKMSPNTEISILYIRKK